ncbi:hypothetical protein KI387_016397, partial [Taxus chinensis]
DEKFKLEKLQTYRAQFENLKMKDDESIITYMQRIDEVINMIRGLGEKLEEYVIVQKILRSLTGKFDAKSSALEEAKDMKTLTMDEL